MLLGPIGSHLNKATFQTLEDITSLTHRNKHRKLGKMRVERNMFQTKEQDKTIEKS